MSNDDQLMIAGVRFHPDFLHAVLEDGVGVHFTATEARMLSHFVRNTGRLCSRQQLLDATAGAGSDSSDRSVDFTVNRLRSKLRDSSRTPRFIATRYGGGYIWLPPVSATATGSARAFMVIGPVRGLAQLDESEGQASAFVGVLRQRCDDLTGQDRAVVIDRTFAAGSGDQAPSFAVDCDFMRSGASFDCVATARRLADGRIILIRRLTGLQDAAAREAAAGDFATACLEKAWEVLALGDQALGHPQAEPLGVSVHNAALAFVAPQQSWEHNDAVLRARLARMPDDPVTRLMLATNIHTKYVLAGMQLLAGQDTRHADEEEIETLLLPVLPALQHHPVHCMAAAKLLFTLGRGYRRTAVDMCEDAFASTTAVSACRAILGQMRMFLGQTDGALDLLEAAREGATPGSEYDAYLLVILGQCHLASANGEGLARVLAALYAHRPLARGPIGLLFASADRDGLAPEVKGFLKQIGERQARAMLLYSTYICARHFDRQDHRDNVLRGLAALLCDRFGEGVVPDEVVEAAPSLFAARTLRRA